MRVKLKITLSDNDINRSKVDGRVWVVEELYVVYGCLRSTPFVAARTMNALIGR